MADRPALLLQRPLAMLEPQAPDRSSFADRCSRAPPDIEAAVLRRFRQALADTLHELALIVLGEHERLSKTRGSSAGGRVRNEGRQHDRRGNTGGSTLGYASSDVEERIKRKRQQPVER